MQKLLEEDRYWVRRRLPNALWKAMLEFKTKIFVAGGFIRACIAREEVNDIDLFAPSKELAGKASRWIVSRGTGLSLVETDNAFTILGLSLPVQFIHRWTFKTAEEAIASFDFTIARAALWVGTEKDKQDHAIIETACDDRFYSDLAAKRLVYCSPARIEELGGSMLRVLKFYQRGYRIPLDSLGAMIARIASGIDEGKIAGLMAKNQTSHEVEVGRVMAALLREVDPSIDVEAFAEKISLRSPK